MAEHGQLRDRELRLCGRFLAGTEGSVPSFILRG
jgi:hypothetical protein